MNTPNLDHVLDQFACEGTDPVWDVRLSFARAELSQLRAAAPQKVEGVPTKPGLYWARSTEPKDWSFMEFNPVALCPGGFVLLFGGNEMRLASDFIDYHGPLTPPSEPTKAVTP